MSEIERDGKSLAKSLSAQGKTTQQQMNSIEWKTDETKKTGVSRCLEKLIVM